MTDKHFTQRKASCFFEMTGEYVRLIGNVVFYLFRQPPSWALVREQLYSMGVLSVGVVAITGFTTGVVLAAQSFYQLGEKGLSCVIGVLVTKAMITELGPILTAFMVTGRVGSSICAEIGSMKVTEQIDALQSMAVHPNRYLIAPRFFAGLIMIPLLTLFSAIVGIIGGYLISTLFFHMPSSSYINPIPLHVGMFDLASCLIKSFIFSIILITVCCYKGLQTSGGAAGVGKATTQSVVTSYVLILIFDLLLTITINMIYKQHKLAW
jgi:phospholipid/cholesterol/gamma-HCH transport system permease protein